jgi:homoserine O-succinyltransferase/O-acetyltransferase
MPVVMEIDSADHHLAAAVLHNRERMSSREALADCVKVGLINNMPDGALVPTERQLFDLLNQAAGTIPVHLQLYALPTVSRSSWAHQYIDRYYLDADELLRGALDGVIVTGAEPRADKLTNEPYWNLLGKVIDWAQENTASAMWSCLAVHGAVLYIDGIERRQLPKKCIGVFEQTQRSDHVLLNGSPPRFGIPHSRWNEVSEPLLASSGYTILTSSEEAGADIFVKQAGSSLFVYFQGHPEYDAHSLLGEYRRDIGRFLRGEIERYPTMPQGYFDTQATKLLATFQNQAHTDRRHELLSAFPVDAVSLKLKNTWRLTANQIYRNWITYIADANRRTKQIGLGRASRQRGVNVPTRKVAPGRDSRPCPRVVERMSDSAPTGIPPLS